MINLTKHLIEKKHQKKLFIPYLTPFLTDDWEKLLFKLEELGADAIEIGIPFSDPAIDGPVIQKASNVAIKNGGSFDAILERVKLISSKLNTPLIAMTYANILYKQGFNESVKQLEEAGFSALIIADLPWEEKNRLNIKKSKDFAIINLVAPSTNEDRLQQIASSAEGFVYCVANMATTGVKSEEAASFEFINLVKKYSSVPVLAGIGIANIDDAKDAASFCDGFIVGSSLLKWLLDGDLAGFENLAKDLGSLPQNA